jgi:vesicle transport through interaction with t-SNAREs 1
MSSEILRNYEQQFGILCADITNKVSHLITQNEIGDKNTNKNSNYNSIDALFVEAKELIEQMELEVREITSKQNLNGEQKQKQINIIKSYSNELSKLEGEFKRRKMESEQIKNRQELFDDDSRDDDTNLFNNTKKSSSKNDDKLVKMSKNLNVGYKVALETEEIGTTILSDLYSQRETIERSRDRLRDANTDLRTSSRVLTGMMRRIMANKFLLFGLGALMFIFIIFVIYITIKRKF